MNFRHLSTAAFGSAAAGCLLANLAAAEWLVDSFKHSRSYGVQNIVVTHRISDLQATGDDGSRVSRLTQGLISDAETKAWTNSPAFE